MEPRHHLLLWRHRPYTSILRTILRILYIDLRRNYLQPGDQILPFGIHPHRSPRSLTVLYKRTYASLPYLAIIVSRFRESPAPPLPPTNRAQKLFPGKHASKSLACYPTYTISIDPPSLCKIMHSYAIVYAYALLLVTCIQITDH